MTGDSSTIELKFVSDKGELILDLSPLQGLWTEEQYLALTNQTNLLIEFTDGKLEILPMPTRRHQLILLLIYEALRAVLRPRGGIVLVAPMRMQIRSGKFREPDVLALLRADDPRNQEAFWLGADLVVEVVSPDDPTRDLAVKPDEYAQAGIQEYWIVNPLDETVTVLTLEGTAYRTHGVFRRGERAVSKLIEGFGIDVDTVFDVQ